MYSLLHRETQTLKINSTVKASPSPLPISCREAGFSWGLGKRFWPQWPPRFLGRMAPDLGNSPRGVAERVWGRTGQIIRAFTRGLCLLFQCKLAISSAWHRATSLPRPTGSTCHFVLGWRPADWVARNRLSGAGTKSIVVLYLADCPCSVAWCPRDSPQLATFIVGRVHSGVGLSGIFCFTKLGLHRGKQRRRETALQRPHRL